MGNEIWASVLNQKLFEISSIGRIRSYKGVGRCPKPVLIPKILKPCKDGRGYLNFTVRQDGKPKVLLIHIEMAKTFIPNPNNYKLVRHLNDIKTDNRLFNLAWGNYSDNMKDSILNGKRFHHNKSAGVRHKLSSNDIKKIVASGKNNCEMSRKYGVSESTISKIRLGRNRSNITGIIYSPNISNK